LKGKYLHIGNLLIVNTSAKTAWQWAHNLGKVLGQLKG